MKITVHERIGAGQFGELYRGTDDLGREVAVKFIRQSSGDAAFALNQARALARATHSNVVAVFGMETLNDPVGGVPTQAIVMEYVDGMTLKQLCAKDRLSIAECERIGHGIIDGIEHIHRQGLQHGDLHVENVLIGLGQVKIIDLLYYDTLAQFSTQSREARLSSDITGLRHVLQFLLDNSHVDARQATGFGASIARDASLTDIRDSFRECIGATSVNSASGFPSTGDVIAVTKELLIDDKKLMLLHDLVYRQVDFVARSLAGEEFDVTKPLPDASTVQHHVSRCDHITGDLLRAISTTAMWGRDQHRTLITKSLSRLTKYPSTAGTTYKAWVALQKYPALLLLYAGGIAALGNGNVANFAAMLTTMAEYASTETELPLVAILSPNRVMATEVAKLLPGLEDKKVPQSEYLLSTLRVPIRELLHDDSEYELAFDRFEYLTALVGIDVDHGAYVGRFGYRLSYPISKLDARFIRAAALDSSMLQAGLFEGSADRLAAARAKLEQHLESGRYW